MRPGQFVKEEFSPLDGDRRKETRTLCIQNRSRFIPVAGDTLMPSETALVNCTGYCELVEAY